VAAAAAADVEDAVARRDPEAVEVERQQVVPSSATGSGSGRGTAVLLGRLPGGAASAIASS
jgi:hypothetical protein